MSLDQSIIYLGMYLSELIFCDKRRFKRLNMALMIKKKQVTLILFSFTPSDMNFQTFLLLKGILAKTNSQKNLLTQTILILSILQDYSDFRQLDTFNVVIYVQFLRLQEMQGNIKYFFLSKAIIKFEGSHETSHTFVNYHLLKSFKKP